MLSKGELRLVTQLPYERGVREVAPAVPGATHVLLGNRAYPLANNPFGLPSEGKLGDVVTKDGKTFQLIVVEA